jgi:hypothetical protein
MSTNANSTLTEKDLLNAAAEGVLKQVDDIIAAGENGNLRKEIGLALINARINAVKIYNPAGKRAEAAIETLTELRSIVRRTA